MTNEQLALYLRSLACDLTGLANEVKSLIAEGEREEIPVWVGKGKPDKSISDSVNSTWIRYYSELPEGWESRPEGEFKAVTRIRDFARWALTIEADKLERNGKAENND